MRKIDIEKAKEYYIENILILVLKKLRYKKYTIEKSCFGNNYKLFELFNSLQPKKEQEEIENEIKNFIKNDEKSCFLLWDSEQLRKFNKIEGLSLKNIYDIFVSNKELAYNFAKSFVINACPYCNEHYIYSNNEAEIRPEFDHFLPKSKYPLFAMCFYNLIPSCHQCNHKKSEEDTKLLHPFYESFDNYKKFAVIPNSTSINNESDFEIGIQNKLSKENDFMNVKVFKLEERYKEHKDLALELIQKKFLYTEEFVEEIKRKLPKEISNCDINRILYGNYIFAKDINKRPFAKLTKDILDIFDK